MTTEKKWFPIMDSEVFRAIPWKMLEPQEERAKRNHDQDLNRLAFRGGLSPIEALAVLENRPLFPLRNHPPKAQAERRIAALLAAWDGAE